MALTTDQEKCLRGASDAAIQNAFSGLESNFNTVEWLKKSNLYRLDPSSKVKTLSSTIPFHDQHLVEYIAASVPRNCLDAWAYLGASIRAIIAGDVWQARHLAYYAELRAAFAILASEGIGVFDHTHIIVDLSGKCNIFPPDAKSNRYGTHQFTWEAIEFWSKETKGSKLFGNQISAFGFSLNDWLNKLPIPHSSVSGYELLSEWGFDLKMLSVDRSVRNQVSYCPEFNSKCEYQSAIEIYQVLESYWQLAEPTLQTFTQLDKFIVKLSLHNRHKHSRTKTSLSDAIDKAVDKLFPPDLGGEKNRQLKQFFTDKKLPDLLQAASNRSKIDVKNQHLEVMARAFLLLRLACASTGNLIQKSGLTGADIQSWWEHEGLKRGLWRNGEFTGDLTDMWAEVKAGIEDVDEWVQMYATDPTKPCIRSLQESQAVNLMTLAKFERVALWSMPQ